MNVYDKSDSKHGVAIRRGTSDVPADGRYHVLVDGVVVASTGVEAAALIIYEEQRESRMAAGRRVLDAERAHKDAQRFKNDVVVDKATRQSRLGGRTRPR